MKYLSLCISLLLVTSAFGQVKPKQPIELQASVQSFVPGPGDIAWVLTSSEIAKTTDGGATWMIIPSDESGYPSCLAFIDENKGWSVNDQGDVYQTADGGHTWYKISRVRQNEIPPGMAAINQLTFTDAANGWLLTPFSLWMTKDGGLTWDEWELGWAKNLQFVDNRIGWISDEDGLLYRSLDKGKTWKVQNREKSDEFQEIFFIDENQGWISPSGYSDLPDTVKYGDHLHTTDGGKSWTPQSLPTGALALTSMQFLNEREGWLTGYAEEYLPFSKINSVVLHTTDGGQHWEWVWPDKAETIYKKVYFSDVQHGWLVTDTGLYRTTDRGRSWKLVLKYSEPPSLHGD